jgi:hypothetical protein
VFARIDDNYRKRYGERYWETQVPRPAAAREKMKHEIEYESGNSKRKKLVAEAEAIYYRLMT